MKREQRDPRWLRLIARVPRPFGTPRKPTGEVSVLSKRRIPSVRKCRTVDFAERERRGPSSSTAFARSARCWPPCRVRMVVRACDDVNANDGHPIGCRPWLSTLSHWQSSGR
ncbi:hypothetical protein X976_5194 [Burkholderia pseudomallei MSHR7500]|nr:hypothetical protein DP42_4632 [Burkholderia pseudomallei]KGS38712.1 hypothetical protein X992_5425 [Burkholderia pseudomallei MSHR5492]KGS86083.1 hypothetical protein X976_5194 [Burkholderia pseudomallei MSHR7500]